MGDNHHLYRHIRKSLMQIYPKQLTGRQAQQMNTLSGMISGIVRSGKSQMRAMAKTAPDRSKVESRIKRFTRFTQNEQVDATTYFLPFLTPLLIGLARSGPLVLAIDGSEVGRNCLALVISVIYKKRALPLVWVVVQGSKGHFPEEIVSTKPLLERERKDYQERHHARLQSHSGLAYALLRCKNEAHRTYLHRSWYGKRRILFA